MPIKTNHRPAVLMALAASAGLTVLIILGSRNLEHYDAALFGYTVASVVAFGAIVFRYAIWLQRPATRVYWRRGWNLYLQRKKFWENTASAAKTLATNMVAQQFIVKRGFARWLTFPDHAFDNPLVAANLRPEHQHRLRAESEPPALADG